MKQRTTVTELFSTFIQFAQDRFDRWISDRRLHQGMEEQLAQGENTAQPEGFWALYWYKLWQGQSHGRAVAHLNAYLQEPCYWAANSITQRFSPGTWTLADGFQSAIAQADRILGGYRPEYGSSLRAYSRTAFSNLIRDQLRQQQDIHICSDWGLLRRLSQVQLQQALLAAGLSPPESAILVWQCFKAVYTPDPRRSTQALPPPTPEQFTQICQRYNSLRLKQNPILPPLAAAALVSSLQQAVQAARTYLTPAVTSLDQIAVDQDTHKTPLDDLSSGDTPLDQLLTAEAYGEQQQRIKQIGQVLGNAIATLPPADQTLLTLYYQQTLTQTEIAQKLQIKQYQVSRQLGRIRQQLLMGVALWSQETLHISLNSAVLASMSDVIHEWLQQHYQNAVEG